MGAPVTLDVRDDGATLTFNVEGTKKVVRTEDALAELQALQEQQ